MYEWTSHQYSIQWIVSSLKSLVYTASSENYSIRFYADPAEDMKFGNFYLKTASRFLKSLFARIIFFLNFFGFLSKLHVKAIIIQYQIIQYQMSCCWKSTWLSLHDLDEVIVKLISFKRNPPPPLCISLNQVACFHDDWSLDFLWSYSMMQQLNTRSQSKTAW